jgi:hypothetical protein
MYALRNYALLLSACLVLSPAASVIGATLQIPADHETIQAAVDASQPGDTILIAAGTYKERIRLNPGIILKSVGDDSKGKLGLQRAEATIIDGGGKNGRGAGVDMAEGSTLDGFTVTNVGLYDEDEWNKHHATQGEEQSYEHIGEPGFAGIGIVGVTSTVKNNIVHHIGYSGIGILGVDGKQCSPLVIKNVCYRNMGGGIGSMNGSTATIKQNVCFQNFFAGIGHDNASPLVVENDCYENIRAGIGISEGSKPIVLKNRCYKNRRAGIGTRTGHETQPLIERNDCYENDMAGIGAREEAAPIIRKNRCYKNKMAGIGSRTGATPVIIGNECYENDLVGIGQRTDTSTILINNYCHHNKRGGIGFAACKKGESRVINNRLIDNALVAVGINPGWKVYLSGNEMSRKGGLPPIVMVFAGSEATFSDNVIRGEGVAGIRVAGKVSVVDNKFEGLTLRKGGPPNFAVWALPNSEVALSENKISSWRHALHASQSTVSAENNIVRIFHKAAFVVQKPKVPARIVGNTIFTDDPNDLAVMIDGEANVVEENELKPIPDVKK